MEDLRYSLGSFGNLSKTESFPWLVCIFDRRAGVIAPSMTDSQKLFSSNIVNRFS